MSVIEILNKLINEASIRISSISKIMQSVQIINTLTKKIYETLGKLNTYINTVLYIYFTHRLNTAVNSREILLEVLRRTRLIRVEDIVFVPFDGKVLVIPDISYMNVKNWGDCIDELYISTDITDVEFVTSNERKILIQIEYFYIESFRLEIPLTPVIIKRMLVEKKRRSIPVIHYLPHIEFFVIDKDDISEDDFRHFRKIYSAIFNTVFNIDIILEAVKKVVNNVKVPELTKR